MYFQQPHLLQERIDAVTHDITILETTHPVPSDQRQKLATLRGKRTKLQS